MKKTRNGLKYAKSINYRSAIELLPASCPKVMPSQNGSDLVIGMLLERGNDAA